MIKRFIAMLLLAIPIAGQAENIVITFDEPRTDLWLPQQTFPYYSYYASTTTQGFVFTWGEDNSAAIQGSDLHRYCWPPCPYNGTDFLTNHDSGLTAAVTMTRTDGRQFHLRQFEGGETTMDTNVEAARIDVVGTRMGGSTVSASFDLDRVNDGMGPLEDFQTFVLPHSFSGLVSVTFNGSGGFYNGPYSGGYFDYFSNAFSLDNISLFSVPEPATLSLIGLGLLGLGFARRRR